MGKGLEANSHIDFLPENLNFKKILQKNVVIISFIY